MIEIKATHVTWNNGTKVETFIHAETFHDDDFGTPDKMHENVINTMGDLSYCNYSNDVHEPKGECTVSSDTLQMSEVMSKYSDEVSQSMRCAEDARVTKQKLRFDYLVNNRHQPVAGYDLVKEALANGYKIVASSMCNFNITPSANVEYKVSVVLEK